MEWFNELDAEAKAASALRVKVEVEKQQQIAALREAESKKWNAWFAALPKRQEVKA